MAHQRNQCHSRWKIQDRRLIKNTDDTETKHNPEKANNAQHSKSKLPWFSRILRHSAGKRDGLILHRSWAHTEQLIVLLQSQRKTRKRESDGGRASRTTHKDSDGIEAWPGSQRGELSLCNMHTL